MHPREFKRQRVGTGRVTRKSLLNSQIFVGVDFTQHDALNAVLNDATYLPLLLFPGETAIPAASDEMHATLQGRNLAIIILDATWSSARKMLRLSENLQQLKRISFEPSDLSRFVIKRQPTAYCLSTIEAVYRLLEIFERRGVEKLQGKHATLMQTLDAMVDFQLRCAADPNLPSHRLKYDK